LLSSILLARGLGPEGRGAFEAIFFLPRLLTPLVQLGLSDANTFFCSRDSLQAPRLFLHSLIVAGSAGLAAAIIALPFLGPLLRQYQGDVITLAAAMLFAIPMGIVSLGLNGLLRGHLAYRSYNIVRFLGPAAELIALAALFFAGAFNLVTVTFQHVFTAGIFVVALQLFLLRRSIHLTEGASWPLLRSTLAYGLKVQTGTVSLVASDSLSRIVLVPMLSPAQFGIFSVATRVAQAILIVPNAFSILLLPEVAKQRADTAIRLTSSFLKLNLLILGVGGVVLAIVLSPLVRLVYGPAFQEAVTPARILLAGVVCSGLSSLIAETLKGLGRPLQATIAYSIGVAVAFICLLVFVPHFGLAGAALGSTAGYAVGLLVGWTLLRFAWRPLAAKEAQAQVEAAS